jgi:circadian clock protein KaiC
MKNRSGAHHRTICELKLVRDGIEVGAPLEGFRGILTGVPVHEGNGAAVADRARS